MGKPYALLSKQDGYRLERSKNISHMKVGKLLQYEIDKLAKALALIEA